MPSGVYKRTPECNAINSASKIGILKSPEHCKAISIAKTGVSLSPEHCKAISIAKIGIPQTSEHIAAVKEALNDPDVKVRYKIGMIKGWNKPGVKERASISKIADLNPNWKGGLSNLPYPLNFNLVLKELIRERDVVCQLCGKTQEQNSERLSIHHIDYIKENLDPKNLITLCRSCNAKVNFNRKYWMKFFQLKIE